ncbi:accessory gene regulator B family protein, partial [Blautia wexlerae]
VNIAMLVRKINVISLDCMFVIYLCFICVIVLFSPVDNPIHPLSKVDSRFYAKRSRQLIFWYSFLLVISIALRIMVLRDSIIYTVLIVGISALAGKWKYRKRVFVL